MVSKVNVKFDRVVNNLKENLMKIYNYCVFFMEEFEIFR